MAEQQQGEPQYNQVYTLFLKPGIKRDGTTFESSECPDATWCRFQRGVPKKMGGYTQLFTTFNGVPRGMAMNSYNGLNYIFSGNQTGLDIFTTGQSLGAGSGPYRATFLKGYSPFSITSNTTNTFTITSTTNLTNAFYSGGATSYTSLVGGTLYTTGTYTNVQLTYVSGATATTYPKATIVVSGGAVTSVTITSPGTGFNSIGTILSCAAASIGGTGSGFSITINAISAGAKIVFNQTSSAIQYTVTSSSFSGTATTVTFSPTITGNLATVYLDNYNFAPDENLLWQFDFQYNPVGGALNLIAHPGLNLTNIDNAIKTQVYYGAITADATNNWNFIGLSDSTGTGPTYQPIVVDGGVCALHPFIFAYGSNGFIANNNVSSTYTAQTFTDWNGTFANQVNVATGKIVKGMPLRGGTASPSGLFWATDSLIRVSFVNNPPIYWNYDIVSSQISIMSSSCVVEMDGLYYWMGVDRFYVYNGVVQVLPNDKNVNWLFDNLNFLQRQKVWATKVPRYNEIWFFYPRGTATECTDAIIYNTKDKIWYDAGSAVGAQRSSGYTSEVFPTPIYGSWNYDVTYGRSYIVAATPSGQPAPTAFQFYLTGDMTPAFPPSSWVTFSNTDENAAKYQVASSAHIFNSTIGGAGATLVTVLTSMGSTPTVGSLVYPVAGGYSIWQHEIGLNAVSLTKINAIYSSFTTCDLSWVGGSPSGAATPGVNRRLHVRRIEPDFVQSGTLNMLVLGKKFAASPEITLGTFPFEPSTEKIDLRLESRELKLKFESNELDGNYEMGRVLATVEFGDERP